MQASAGTVDPRPGGGPSDPAGADTPAGRAPRMIAWLLGSIAALTGLLMAWPAVAWDEPARGTQLRKDLMNAIRPYVEHDLGAPIECVVRELRHSGGVAFGVLEPQRPGGRAIRFADTPLAARGVNPDWYDNWSVIVLYRAVGGGWTVADFSIGATDVWWSDPRYCTEFRPVTPGVC